mmetsp:Transcript_18290/g.27406  ORF Transcript_18290/g.27406 Transcript_18290/m.27406 type:complete len:95 (-) Transcript_18290:171-455(-)
MNLMEKRNMQFSRKCNSDTIDSMCKLHQKQKIRRERKRKVLEAERGLQYLDLVQKGLIDSRTILHSRYIRSERAFQREIDVQIASKIPLPVEVD